MSREIKFSDSNLEDEVRRILCIHDRPITDEDTFQIAELDCTNFEFNEDGDILRFFPNLISLALESHIMILPALRYVPKLQDLYIALWGGDEIDLASFSHLKHLQRLFVSGGMISGIDLVNVDVLAELPELRSLSFHEFGKVDLKFLEKMPELEEFMCGWPKEVKNIESIRSLKKLKSLRLLSVKMRNIDFLEAFLDSLELEMSATIEEACDIEKLKRFSDYDICEMTVNGEAIPDAFFEHR